MNIIMIQKANNSNTSNNDNKSLGNNNGDKSYDCSYVLLTQACLTLAFHNHE